MTDGERVPLLGAAKSPVSPNCGSQDRDTSSRPGTSYSYCQAEKFVADVRAARRESSDNGLSGGTNSSVDKVDAANTSTSSTKGSVYIEIEKSFIDSHGGDTSWKLNVDEFKKYQVDTTSSYFKTLPRKVQKFYHRQNAIIHSYVEVERRFGCYTSGSETLQQSVARVDWVATHVSNAFNLCLLASKILVVYWSGSLAVVSSLIDSCMDMLSGVVLLFAAIGMQHHNTYLYPVGRKQLEPVAIVVLATVMAVAYVELIKESVVSLVSGNLHVSFDVLSMSIMGITVITKSGLWLFCRTKNTPTCQTLALDHFNDVVSNIGAMLFAWGATHYWLPLDATGAILMALYIAFSWVVMAKEQIKGLSGHSASIEFLSTMVWIAINHHPDIVAIASLSAYHVGPKLVAEVDIVLEPHTSLPLAHDIAETLQLKYEDLEEVDRSFVHADFEIVHDRRMEHARHL